MRARALLAVAAAAVLLGGNAGHAATPKPPVLDGKKIKKIEFKGDAGMNNHDQEFLTGDDRDTCQPPDCAVQTFTFKPAKGVTGDLVANISWTGTGNDMDLALYDAEGKEVTACGGTIGSKEWIAAASSALKVGSVYTVRAWYYRTNPSSTVTGVIEFPGTKPKEPYPFLNPIEDLFFGDGHHALNCAS